jgi:hypothetical protein
LNRSTKFAPGTSLLLAALFQFGPGYASAAQGEGDAVLDKLRAFDQLLAGPLTMKLQIDRIWHSQRPEQGMVHLETVYTRSADRWAIMQESRYERDPVYHAAGGAYSAIDFDDVGNLLVWHDARVQVFVAPDFAAKYTDLQLYRVKPSNEIAGSEPGAPAVLLFQPHDAGDFVNSKVLFWAAGRGFEPELQDFKSATTLADGAIQVEAAGSEGNIAGTWRLRVEPANGYLVREASFTNDGQSDPMFVIRTQGTQWAGDVAYPESADYSLAGDRPESMVHVVFEMVRSNVDSALLERVEKTVRGPYPLHSDVIDYRDRAAGPRDLSTP